MHQVEVGSVSLARLEGLLPHERAAQLETCALRARAVVGDRVLWHVSATGRGGGVAEMLQTMLAYGRGAGIENRWLVLDGDPDFFAITKRIHNMLHGDPGDGGPLGAPEHAHYLAVLSRNLEDMLPMVSPGDLVVLHDPQTAGLAEPLRSHGLRVAWRSHVGRDRPSALSIDAWEFLRPFLSSVEQFVFSRRSYAPDWVDPDRLQVIAPSIDPFSPKNTDLSEDQVVAVLATVGLVEGGTPAEVGFVRRSGGSGIVRPATGLVLDGPPPPYDARLIVQVSRWDRLKDMPGVMAAFALLAAGRPGDQTHLMLAGPATAGVTDDPEGAEVLAECRKLRKSLSVGVRDRVHLAAIPLDDIDENAVVVNALQRHAFAVVQKSLVEGFGLTVTEAMWKGKPVVASAVGGIQDQIVDGIDGLLLENPRDLEACARTLARLLDAPDLALRLGRSARARVLAQFIGDRHLEQYADLLARLVGPADPAALGRRRAEPSRSGSSGPRHR